MKITKNLVVSVSILLLVNIAVILAVQSITMPAAATVYSEGASGENVKKIQTKLSNWGYFNGKIDGVYGAQTSQAIKKFQSKNGLTPDGIAGSDTLRALGMSNAANGGQSNSAGRDGDLDLLARMISAESRGEPYHGQVAVGAVILNRVDHPSFPNSISGVIYQPGAFSAIGDGQFNEPTAEISRRAAKEAMNGTDPSGGAIYYYNPAKTTNKWIYSRPVIGKIGKHTFAK